MTHDDRDKRAENQRPGLATADRPRDHRGTDERRNQTVTVEALSFEYLYWTA